MLLPSTASKVVAAVFFAVLFNRSVSVRGVFTIDRNVMEKSVSDFLRAQRHLLKVARRGSTYHIVIHATLWDILKVSVPAYNPYDDEPELVRRKYGKTYRGALSKDDLVHALRWVKRQGVEMRQFDIYFPLNKEVVWDIMRNIEGRVKHS